uniref:Fibronectin type-III domain-containing protein n=1 Tax=viral metagenome TaxID=1070528 RepID=A0A6C0DAR2_9ZZZZ
MSVPGAPTIGVITPGNGQLSVAFTSTGATPTNMEYSIDNGTNWVLRSGIATPVIITGLANGTSYTVMLRAKNASGTGPSSSAGPDATTTPRTTPGAPTITTITCPSSGTIQINFTAPVSNGGSAITNYAYSTTGAAGTFTNIAPLQTTSPITVSGLANGTPYQVSIRAINAAGNGTAAIAVAATPYTTPAAPTIGTITFPSSGTLSVPFTAGATNGNVLTNYEYSTDGGSNWTVRSPSSTATPIIISGLTNGVACTVKLRAVNAAGAGATQASGTAATPRTVPDAPTGVTVTPGATTVLSIAWTAPANNGGNAITFYKIERSLDGVSSWTALTSAQASSPYNSTGLTNGTVYHYRVSATNTAGFGAVSSTASGTPRTVPGAPTTVSVTTSSSTDVSVSFTAPASNGGNTISSYVVTPYIGLTAQTTVSGASSPISVTGLTTGQSYTFKVQAVNAAGAGTQSAASAAVSLLYNSVSAPNNATFTYASGVAFTDSKITYTGTAFSDVTITPSGTAWTISAAGKTDTFNYVRKVVFTDKIVYLAGSGVDAATGSSTVGSYTMTKTIVGGANVIAAYISDAATEYTANSKPAVIYIAGDTIYTPSPAAPGTTITSPVSIVGVTMNSKKPLISRWDNYTLRYLMIKSSDVTIENIIFDLYVSATTQNEINAGSVDIGFINPNLTLLANIVFKNVDMVRGYQKGVNMNYVTNVTFDGCTFARVSARATIGMSSCKNVTIKNCTIPRSGTTLTGYGSIYISTSNGPRDIYATSATYNNTRAGWTDAQKLDAVKTQNIDLSLNNTFTDDNSLPATIQIDPYKAENGNDSFQYSLTFTGTNPDVKLPSNFGYSFSHYAAAGTAILKTNITKNSTDISGALATWGFDPTNVTVRSLDTNARIYPTGYELPFSTFDPTTITNETSIPISIGGTRTVIPILDSNSLSGLTTNAPVFVTGVSAAPKLAVFTASDPGAAVKNSIDNSVNAVAVQRTVKGAAKTSVMEVKKRSAVTSVVATKTVGGQTQTATADISSLPSTHSVILSVDDIDATAGLKANVYFKVIDENGNVVTNGISLPIDFDVPGTEAVSVLDLYVYNTTTSNYDQVGSLTKKVGTTTTFSYTFTTNSDYQLVLPSPSAPGAPTIDSVTPGDSQLSVAFTAGSNGGSAITDYEYTTNSGSTWTSSDSSSSPITITSLTNGTSYTVQLRAVNTVGSSSASNDVSGTPAGLPLGPVVDLSGTASDGIVTLTWTSPNADDIDNGSAITRFNIYQSTDGGTTWTQSQQIGLSDPVDVIDLSNGISYFFAVAIVNGVGEGAKSSAVGPLVPTQPVTLSFSNTSLVYNNQLQFPTVDNNVTVIWKNTDGSTFTGATTVGSYPVTATPTGTYSGEAVSVTLTITQAPLTIDGVTAADKVYDGTSNAVLSGGSLTGVIGSDSVGIVDGSGSFSQPNVGSGLTVTASGFSIDGANSGNYQLTAQPTVSPASITQAPLTITGGITRYYYNPVVIDSFGNYSGIETVAGGFRPFSGQKGYSAVGFMSGDSITSVHIDCSGNHSSGNDPTAQPPNYLEPGTYASAVTPSAAQGVGLNNYTITYVPGNLTVLPTVAAQPTITTAAHGNGTLVFSYVPPDNTGGVPITSYRLYFDTKFNIMNYIYGEFIDAPTNSIPNPYYSPGLYDPTKSYAALDNYAPSTYHVDISAGISVGVLNRSAKIYDSNDQLVTDFELSSAPYQLKICPYNSVGPGFTSYNLDETTLAPGYSANISRGGEIITTIGSQIIDGQLSDESIKIIDDTVTASAADTYTGLATMRGAITDTDVAISAYTEARTIALVGGDSLGVPTEATGDEAMSIYTHMVAYAAQYPGTVSESLLETLHSDICNGTPLPVTWANFIIDTTGQQIEPYPVIPVTNNGSNNIIPMPHDISINFVLQISDPLHRDNSGFVNVTRSGDNSITALSAGAGIRNVFGFNLPLAAGSSFTVMFDDGDTCVVYIPALADSVITIGGLSYGISSDGKNVWVVNYVGDSVTRIDALSGLVVGESIPVGLGPVAISSDGKYVWVVNNTSNTVTRIDASSGLVVGEPIPVSLSANSISSDGKNVWVTHYYSNNVTRIDALSGLVIGNPISVGTNPNSISSDGKNVWVANKFSNNVTRIDASSGSVIGEPISVGSGPNSISSDGKNVWVANYYSNTVTRIDALSGSGIVYTVPVGFSPNAISSDGTNVWVANFDRTVTRINALSGSVVGEPISTDSFPFAISSDGTNVWVAMYGGSVLKISIPVDLSKLVSDITIEYNGNVQYLPTHYGSVDVTWKYADGSPFTGVTDAGVYHVTAFPLESAQLSATPGSITLTITPILVTFNIYVNANQSDWFYVIPQLGEVSFTSSPDIGGNFSYEVFRAAQDEFGNWSFTINIEANGPNYSGSNTLIYTVTPPTTTSTTEPDITTSTTAPPTTTSTTEPTTTTSTTEPTTTTSTTEPTTTTSTTEPTTTTSTTESPTTTSTTEAPTTTSTTESPTTTSTTEAPTTTSTTVPQTNNIPCFVAGTLIRTPTGEKAVELLRNGDTVVTADGRSVPVNVYSTTLNKTTKGTAPYLVPAHSFGRNSPPADIRLSPLHAFQIKKGLWMNSLYANNKAVQQYAVGEAITYYHVECPNFFRDNLLANGCVVESFAGRQVANPKNIYTFNSRLGGFTRATGVTKTVAK